MGQPANTGRSAAAVSVGGQRRRRSPQKTRKAAERVGGTARRRLSHVDNRSLESFNGLRRDGLDADLWCQCAGWFSAVLLQMVGSRVLDDVMHLSELGVQRQPHHRNRVWDCVNTLKVVEERQ